MTYDEVNAILDNDETMFFELWSILDDKGLDEACLYIQMKTGCEKEIAQKIVIETRKEIKSCRNEAQIQPAPISSKATVTCTYCGSTNTKKISGTSRWLSTGLFGIASNKMGKNFHCNNCGADF